jgi:hypothetical protein
MGKEGNLVPAHIAAKREQIQRLGEVMQTEPRDDMGKIVLPENTRINPVGVWKITQSLIDDLAPHGLDREAKETLNLYSEDT